MKPRYVININKFSPHEAEAYPGRGMLRVLKQLPVLIFHLIIFTQALIILQQGTVKLKYLTTLLILILFLDTPF